MYATLSDIVELHGAEFLLLVAARGADTALSDEATTTAITDALAHSSSESDGYLSVRYPTPVTPTPRMLQNATINMSVYHLASTADRMTDIIRERYKDALTWLKDISSGRANLPPPPDGLGGTVQQAAPEISELISNDPLFKRGGW
jgi:phage gp36-like protein